MYERRSWIRDGYAEYADLGEVQQELARAYAEFRRLYALYTNAYFAINPEYIPVGKNEATNVYEIPLLETAFEDQRRRLEQKRAHLQQGGGASVETDRELRDINHLLTTLDQRKEAAIEDAGRQWDAYVQLCTRIANNLYVEQFFDTKQYLYVADGGGGVPSKEAALEVARQHVLDALVRRENPFV